MGCGWRQGMAGRHELTDGPWELVQDLFPAQGRGGKWEDHRTLLNGVMWRLRTGAPRRDGPDRFGKWPTVYHRFSTLRRDGLLDGILERLQQTLDAAGLIETDLWCIDGTNVRASRSAAGARKRAVPGEPTDHALGRSRGGFGTKVHLVCDGSGLP